VSSPSPEIDRAWIIGLPKAEVHLHLEGCIPHDLVVSAALRQGARSPGSSKPPAITSLSQLLAYLDWSCRLIDQADELAVIAYDTAARAARSGARHIDVIVNPTHWPRWQSDLGAMIDALDGGFAAAETDGLASATLCLSLKRSQSASEANQLVDWLLDRRPSRVSALSIDGDESGGSHTERFVEAFRRAQAGGLASCAHAGESSGAPGVREALEDLGVDRIDHGVRAVEDPAVVHELATRRVPLDVCPTSNVVLGVSPSLARHPIEALRQAGVRVSLNTDDPLLYDLDLVSEYERCAAALGWTRPDLVELARTSIESCFADIDRRAVLLQALEAYPS
jgi:adenosine deaminase